MKLLLGIIIGIVISIAGMAIAQKVPKQTGAWKTTLDLSQLAVEGSPLLAALAHGTYTDYDYKTKAAAQYRAIRTDKKGYVICSPTKVTR